MKFKVRFLKIVQCLLNQDIMNKKNMISLAIIVLAVSVLTSLSLASSVPTLSNSLKKDYSTKGLTLDFNLKAPTAKDLAMLGNENDFTPQLGKSFIGFKEALGFRESSNNYFTVNKYGYLGKYQFGKSTLKMIGINDAKTFLNTPEMQEKAFIANTERNKWILRREIKRFVGSYIKGVKITESGILAAAHLGGPGNVRKYLRSYGKNCFKDGLGTSVRDYMKRFSGFDTSSVEANKRAKVLMKA